MKVLSSRSSGDLHATIIGQERTPLDFGSLFVKSLAIEGALIFSQTLGSGGLAQVIGEVRVGVTKIQPPLQHPVDFAELHDSSEVVFRLSDKGSALVEVFRLALLSNLQVEAGGHGQGVLQESVERQGTHEPRLVASFGGVEGLDNVGLSASDFPDSEPADAQCQVELVAVREFKSSATRDFF